ncbi:hypothetical protein ACFL24_01805 [Patescibacteria group bacterium]
MKKRTKRIMIIAAIASFVIITGAIGTITLAKIINKPASASAGWQVVGELQPFGVLNSYLNDQICSADKNQNVWTYHGWDDIWKYERTEQTRWDNKVKIKSKITMRNITVDPNNLNNGIGITRDTYKLYQGTGRFKGVSWKWDKNSFSNWPELIDISAIWDKSTNRKAPPKFVYGMRRSDRKIIGAAYPFDNPELVEGIVEGTNYGIGVSPDGTKAIVATGNYDSNLHEYDIDTTGLIFTNEKQILIDEQPQLFPTYLGQHELLFSIDTPKYGLNVWLAKDISATIDSLNLK